MPAYVSSRAFLEGVDQMNLAQMSVARGGWGRTPAGLMVLVCDPAACPVDVGFVSGTLCPAFMRYRGDQVHEATLKGSGRSSVKAERHRWLAHRITN